MTTLLVAWAEKKIFVAFYAKSTPGAWNALIDKPAQVWLRAGMQSPRLFGTLDPFIESGAVMGRKVANAALLDALMRADPFDEYHFFMPSPRERDMQAGLLTARYPELAGRGKFKVLTRRDLGTMLPRTGYAVFHLSDCITSQARLAAARNALAQNIFPITGTTHSLSYANYPREFLAHLWPGTTRRDAIVATSTAGASVVSAIFESLRRGYGLSERDFPAPEIARVPLGVDPAQWGPLTGEARLAARERLGITPAAVVLLVFGRVSHSSKMDLLPLFRAVRRVIASGVDPRALHCLAAGWTDDDDGSFVATLTNLAANIGLPFQVVKRPSEVEKRELFGLSDIFLSVADNPQETFGLTLLEAMAAGLPVVASDYDGYRDIVVHGETGWLVPTMGLDETDRRDVLAPLCYDNHTHLLLAQGLAVDVPVMADALAGLIGDAGMRQAMGRAGRVRAESVLSWDAVVQGLLNLWERLAGEPVPDREFLARTRHPAAMAYGEVFRAYAGETLSDAVRLVWSRAGQAVYRRQDYPVVYEGLGGEIMPEALRTLLFLARSGCPGATLASRLAAGVPELDLFAARFHVLWALKQDLLEKVDA